MIYYHENKNTPYIFYGRNKYTQYIFYGRKMNMMKTNCLYIEKKKPYINLQISHDPFWLAHEKQMSHDSFFIGWYKINVSWSILIGW